MSTASRGRIVWVEITDQQGRNPKLRPAVIITGNEEIHEGGEIDVVGVSSQVEATPLDVRVELPWHRDGHPRTGLRARSVAVCSWVRRIFLADIEEFAGVVPARQLIQILDLVAKQHG